MKTSEEAAGMHRRRSTRLRSQFHPSEEDAEEGAQVTCRRSPLLHPQINASEDSPGLTRRRHTSQAAAASLPEDDDMLREILLRLPPQPSSLPRASAVCKRWRGLVTDPKFHRQFYAHHRKPPFLGVFSRRNQGQGIVFNPILAPPDCIPPQRFDLGFGRRSCYDVLDCRHGRVLVKNLSHTEVFVCDPIISEQRCLSVPPEFMTCFFNGAVLCAARDQGHVHGGCYSSPFKVVLMCMEKYHQYIASVYTSETGIWGNIILPEVPCEISGKPAVLVRNCLYWLSFSDDILEFDLDEHSLTMIKGPPLADDILFMNHQIIRAEHGVVGYITFSYPRFQMWQRNINGHGVAMWVLWKTIEMHSIFKLPHQTEEDMPFLLGYDDDSDVIFLSVSDNVHMVELKSMRSRKLYETIDTFRYHPFKSFYTPGEGKAAAVLAESIALHQYGRQCLCYLNKKTHCVVV